MLPADDPGTTTSVPGMPFVTQRRVGPVVHLAWNEANTGNSTVKRYRISGETTSGSKTLLATVSGNPPATSHDDLTATHLTQPYYYKVTPINRAGFTISNT